MNKNVFIPVDKFENEKKYWLDKLSGELRDVGLTADFPGEKAYEAAHHRFFFEEEITRQVIRISKDNDLSLFVLLLAAFKILLFKYTGQDEIIVASPTYSVSKQQFNRIVIFRDFLYPENTFKEILLKVKQTAAEGYKNQYFPIKRLVDLLDIDNTCPLSLFRVVVLLENIHDRESAAEVTRDFINDITVAFRKTGGQLEAGVTYNRGLFKIETVKKLFDVYFHILTRVLKNTGTVIKDIEAVTEKEKNEILYRFNDTAASYPWDKTIHRLFEEQVRRTPGNTAVALADKHLTYRALDENANLAAGALKEKGVRNNCIVGLMMGNSPEMVAGILGVLKAGGAYLPMDPGYPRERKRYILEDSRVKVFLTGDNVEARGLEGAGPAPKVTPDSLAYVIYTSGTSGKPKGVCVRHRGIVNYSCWRLRSYGYTERDVTLQLLSYCFDGFGANFYSSLFCGGILIMVPDAGNMDYEYINEIIRLRCVTNISLVPGMYEALLDIGGGAPFDSVRFLVLAGERTAGKLLEKSMARLPDIMYINEYGPTETSVTAVANTDMTGENSDIIGTPISNTRIYILDISTRLQLVPVGIPGELCIHGDGVAGGYLNNPELTAEKFTMFYAADPDPGRIYRTGDLARWLEQGIIQFLGRIDQQVKIRGYRVEPGEIKDRLLRHDKVEDAVVVARDAPGEREEGSRDKYLCAYIVSKEKPDAAGLKEFLSGQLPEYMMPSSFVQIDAIPLTANGKVDRKALPAPGSGAPFTAPRDETEEILAGIWSEVLGIEKVDIGIDHNFFQLGGHSLRATVQAAKIHKKFNVNVPLEDMFKLTTIRKLAQFIKKTGEEKFAPIEAVEKREYYPLSSAQKRLYFVQQMEPGNTSYNIPEMVALKREPDREKLAEIFKQLIGRHESLRTSFEMVEEVPVQRVHDGVDFEIEQTGKDNFFRSFDLSRAPLLRAGLAKERESGYIVMVNMHHVITDGTSQKVLIKEFMRLYAGEEPLPLKLQYKDYSQWQNSQMKTAAMIRQEEYWLGEFTGDIPLLNLPTDYQRTAAGSFKGDVVSFEIGGEETRTLKEMALEEGVTLYMILLALYNIFLAKICRQEDILVGTPSAGRRHADLEQVIGMFVNVLALKNNTGSGKTFAGFLREVKEKTLKAYENQDYPYDRLVEKLGVGRDLSRSPFVETQFVWLEGGGGGGGENVSPSFEIKETKLDITLQAAETARGIACQIHYMTCLFKRNTIEKFCRYFLNILESTLRKPGIKLGEIELVTEADKKRMAAQTRPNKEIFGKFKGENFNEDF